LYLERKAGGQSGEYVSQRLSRNSRAKHGRSQKRGK